MIAAGRVEFLQHCIVDAYQRGVFLGLKESDLKAIFSEALSDITIKQTIYNYNKSKKDETESKKIKSTDRWSGKTM